ncbi:MAG: nuclear transport factor 2 family protein [Alphaproteobacteria bacterium]|nr:nuclear transport factor 2 family protein [Alphaproteobacteria bacterium]
MYRDIVSMDSPPLGNGQLSSEGRAWHTRFNDALASRDLDRYLAFLHDDCSMQINNAMPIYSKRAIESSYSSYLTTFVALEYEIMTVFGDDRQSVCEVLYTYICNDGSTEVIQTAYLVDRDEAGLILAVRVYGNGARVFKPFMRAND